MRTLLLIVAITFCSLINNRLIAALKTDTLNVIIQSKDAKVIKQQKIARLCYDRFLRSPGDEVLANAMVDTMIKYNLSGQQELRNLAGVLIHRRKLELQKAEKLLSRSIVIAQQHSEKIFLYQFYLNFAYIQTDLGNPLNAVYHYRLARKIAEELENEDLFITTDIGISDIYMHIGHYPQAIAYLDQAQQAYTEQKAPRASTQLLIYLNKAEIYFKTGQLDSLNSYIELTRNLKNNSSDTERNLKRLQYFELILKDRHDRAIPLIRELLTTGNQYYKNLDRWYLAECYYHNSQLDSAFATAKTLLSSPQKPTAQLKLDAYKLLATILQHRNQPALANQYLALALAESEDYTQRITKIGDLASELRLDRMEAGYHAKNLIYEKERTILTMAIILAILALIVIIASYRNIKQKNRFQKLLHQARSKELAFINSHQVRKPLANILGICSLLEDHQTDMEEMKQYIKLVKQEANEMDNSITAIEKKLSIQA